MTERWLPVVGWEGFYDVSDQGRVRSLSRQTPAGTRGGRVLKANVASNGGHLFVGLCRNGKVAYRYVHRLVLMSFVGPCPHGMEACHFPDAATTNNNLLNLRWDTRSANKGDAIFQGTFPRIRKYDHDEIIALRARGVSCAQIRQTIGISESHLRKLLAGKTWQRYPERPVDALPLRDTGGL